MTTMFVIKLPNGNLMAPESATDHGDEVLGDAYVEVSPQDPDYARLSQQAISEEEMQAHRQRWRDGDEALRLEFERYRASVLGTGQGGEAGH
ncbi:MAG TPA: hypothetical protein VGS19_09655 [Streptosporangiaceae bacterium]|nr:hypothetical protein [Streptosporangiaceae bacterium]